MAAVIMITTVTQEAVITVVKTKAVHIYQSIDQPNGNNLALPILSGKHALVASRDGSACQGLYFTT
jgi:hypothetical protein